MVNKIKKILFIGKRSYNSLGSYDYEYLKRLKKSKLDASIFFACSTLHDQKFIKDIKYLKLFNYHNLPTFRKCLSYINSLLKILKFIKKTNPDVLHLQWLLLPFIDLIFLKTIKLVGWDGLIVITIHNAKSRNSYITKYFLDLCYRHVDNFVVHSPMCKVYLLSHYEFIKSNSIYVGRHGVIKLKNKQTLKNNELKVFNLICKFRKKYKNIYIYIGNLSKYKGFDLLLDSWKIYKKNSKDKDNSALIVLGKAEKSIKKFLDNSNIDHSIIIHNSFVSDKLINLAVDQSNFILLTHRYISHSGIHSSLLRKCIPFIYNKNQNNHMIAHRYFKKTGIPFNNSVPSLTRLFYKIEKQSINFKCNSKDWKNAIDYFSWENGYPNELLDNIYN